MRTWPRVSLVVRRVIVYKARRLQTLSLTSSPDCPAHDIEPLREGRVARARRRANDQAMPRRRRTGWHRAKTLLPTHRREGAPCFLRPPDDGGARVCSPGQLWLRHPRISRRPRDPRGVAHHQDVGVIVSSLDGLAGHTRTPSLVGFGQLRSIPAEGPGPKVPSSHRSSRGHSHAEGCTPGPSRPRRGERSSRPTNGRAECRAREPDGHGRSSVAATAHRRTLDGFPRS